MTKGGLGSLPQGLEWITKKKVTPQAQPKKSEEVEKPIEQVKVEPIKVMPVQVQKEIVEEIEFTQEDFSPKIDEPSHVQVEEPTKKTTQKRALKTASVGLQEGFTRATFIIKEEHIDKLKALAYVKQTPIKDLVDQAMAKFLKDKNVADILSEAIKSKFK